MSGNQNEGEGSVKGIIIGIIILWLFWMWQKDKPEFHHVPPPTEPGIVQHHERQLEPVTFRRK